jgi:aspartate aminotransferase
MEISAQAQEMKARGLDVISMAAGEPDFNTPLVIQEAATRAMAEGITRYTPAPGFLALRETLADKITRENGFQVSPEEIVITAGAKHALYLALQCLAEPGDLILVPTPAWVSYTPMIELTGASIFPLPLYEEDGYQINVDRWKGLSIPPNAKGILINTPSNPTGVVYSKEELTRLVGWAMQRNLWILSDEIYEKILYDGARHTSVAALGPEVKSQTVTVSGFSKSYCMTGWRLGWSVAPVEVAKKMSALQSQSNGLVTAFVQWAGIAAAKLPSSQFETMVGEFDKRRQYCVERLGRLSQHCSFVVPKGAFYVFVNLSKWLNARKQTDVEFCKEMLATQHVGLVPGSSFGKEGAIRLSYATSLKNIEKAFDRLEAHLANAK